MRCLLFFLLGCSATKTDDETEIDVVEDLDGDGFFSDEDCDDNDATVNPNSDEICDGYDNNCNGLADEEVTTIFYVDADGDGFGAEDITTEACEVPNGFVENGSDCDDTASSVYPGAAEQCDGLDNDCNGEIDEGLSDTYYLDADQDGVGDENNPVEECDFDVGLSTITGDCDDNNPDISPLADEVCDGIDNDCNGDIDDGVLNTYYLDSDIDGFGDENTIVESCEAPEGYIENGGDCNDVESFANPNMFEICDGIDNNCDGNIDESGASGESTYYTDSDGDGFGDENTEATGCNVPSGSVLQGGDCDDNEALSNPATVEICDGIDNNCDGSVDESTAVDVATWYEDADGDEYGNASSTTIACDAPSGYVSNSADCNDTINTIHPDALEVCNDIDDDCDGFTDDNDPSITDALTWYLDHDGDDYGDVDFTLVACEQPTNYVADSSDCNDFSAVAYPTNTEICDDVDNDCDGDIDENLTVLDWYFDFDSDGYGDPTSILSSCAQPTGYVSDSSDCDDTDASVNPTATEVYYDGVDQNCDEDSDFDADGDGFESYAEAGGGDCDDNDALIVVCGQSQDSALQDCNEIYLQASSASDGLYWIDPDNDGDTSNAWQAYCDMTRDGGGWTLVMQNNAAVTHSTNISYLEAIEKNTIRGGTYSDTPSDFDIWVGLQYWSDIGTESRYEVGSSPGNPSVQGFYTLSLSPNDNYRVSVSDEVLVGTSTSWGLYGHNNFMQLSAYDADNDGYIYHCATSYGSPWWYNACWSGSIWGYETTNGAYFVSSSDEYNWGALWLR